MCCESNCSVTVLPIKLLACNIDSEDDMSLDCWSAVNCAIWEAICVSDCGFIGSWFCICATKSCRKLFCVKVCCGPEIVSLDVVLDETLFAVEMPCILLKDLSPALPATMRFHVRSHLHLQTGGRISCKRSGRKQIRLVGLFLFVLKIVRALATGEIDIAGQRR